MQFRDRMDAGRQLGEKLAARYADDPGIIVLALPRGGVPIGYEVSRILGCPLDVFIVRKLGVPGHEELAMGAIASGGVLVLNDEVVRSIGIPRREIDRVAQIENRELERRAREYRDGRPQPELEGRTVILVDDGLATGASMAAAVDAVRLLRPAAVVVAVPVGASSTCVRFRARVDDVICLVSPEPFHAVSAWYANFSQTTDEEVRLLLARAAEEHPLLQHQK